MLRICVLLALIVPAIGACAVWRPERTCDEVSARALRNFVQQAGSPNEVRSRIAESYGLAQEQVLVSSHAEGASFQWMKDNVSYSLGTGGGKPASGGMYYYLRPPSVATVIGCFGMPEFYRAQYQRGGPEASWNLLEVFLYFPDQGALGGIYVRSNSKEPPRLSVALPVQSFGFVPVDSLEETMAQLNDNYSAEVRQQIKPWPGDIENIVIQIGPVLN